MDWYFYIAVTIILLQPVILWQAYYNYRYAKAKHKRPREGYRPRTVLIVPCKDLDSNFEKNITSFYNLDYEGYLLWFVVAEEADPAYSRLCKLKEKLAANSKPEDVQIFVAGQGQYCSQKVHNLLYCYGKITEDIEVMAFADSDICVRSDWLSHLVYPLRQPKHGAASGYRWFVPKKNNLASLALSALNAKVAQQCGNSRFNQVWGGSMAIKVGTFRRLGLDKTWQKALSDDLSLSYAVKKAGLKVAFVPACLVASHESTTWAGLLEFGRRQFLITRIGMPGTWWFGFFVCLYSILTLWGTAALALYAVKTHAQNANFFILVPILLFLCQMAGAIMRQNIIGKLLPDDKHKMRAAMVSDIFFFWLWSLLMFYLIVSSAFGRTIIWRGIGYKLISPTETVIISR